MNFRNLKWTKLCQFMLSRLKAPHIRHLLNFFWIPYMGSVFKTERSNNLKGTWWAVERKCSLTYRSNRSFNMPPGHTPGIWHLCRSGEERIWLSESSRGWRIWSPCFRGGEFELHPRFHVKSLAWRPIMGDAVLVASPQTSFGVRLSRIHFSPTDVC